MDIRRFDTLGHADHGWLDARHHFSFAGYHDPARMGWGALRVWNDDRIAGGTGFPAHGHRDMEIVTYVRSGAITHRDSLGNTGRTVAGDVQVMSAGSGVTHAEENREAGDTTLFQIWIEPAALGGEPMWGTRPFPAAGRDGAFQLLASGYGEDGALPIRADARLFAARLTAGQTAEHRVAAGRHAYLVPAVGRLTVNGERVEARDGVALEGGGVTIRGRRTWKSYWWTLCRLGPLVRVNIERHPPA